MNDINYKINTSLRELLPNISLVEDFFSPVTKNKFIIGTNNDALEVLKRIKVDGIINDYNDNLFWNNVPIFSLKDIPTDALVLNCSTSISPISVERNLKNHGITRILTLFDLIYTKKLNYPKPWFVLDMQKSFHERKQEWQLLYDRLKDDESKNTLINLILYRMSANLGFVKNYSVRLKDQYFEDFLEINEECFVDAGGFDGDTTEIFCTKYEDYRKVIFFEPSPSNMEQAKSRLQKFKNISFIQAGLSDKIETLKFSSTDGSASAITNSGEIEIDVTMLDLFSTEDVSFIKMDIEGWELHALKGAENHIKKSKPKLALAVYHKADDFIEICKYIDSICPDYNVYLRHYTEGWSETIMYFKK